MKNTKEIGSREFIVLVACIMLLTALAIDIMLPAFDALREYFRLGEESTATASIVTFFFLGQIGQIIFGPLSDRFGRILILRLGFALYISGCIAAALLPDFNLILAARFVVGMGSSAMSVCATASVRDRFAGDKMARTMSLILTIFLCVPVVAPILGSLILSLSSWQVVFLTPAILAIPIFVWSLRLNESLTVQHRSKLDVPTLRKSARYITGNRTFMRYTAITTILFSAFSSYISSSERMISEIYGRPDLFVWIFGAIGVTMACFSFLNAQLVERFGAKRTIRNLLWVYFGLVAVLFVVTVTQNGTPNIFIFFALVGVLQGVNVAVEPNSSALALEPLESAAGMAAAIYGTSFFVFGAAVGSVIDRALIDTVMPLAVGYAIAGVLTVALVNVRQAKPVVTTTTASEMGD